MECDWEEVDGELGGVAGVQPVLVVRVVGNGSKEAIALRNCLDSLSEERALDRDQANANKLKCQVTGGCSVDWQFFACGCKMLC